MFDCTFNKIRSSEVGMLVKVRPSIPAPELEYEPIEITGRDGILIPTVKRYQPIEIEVEFNFMSRSPDKWNDLFRKAKRWLFGSGDLSFSDDDEYFYKVYTVRIDDTERTSYRIGEFMAVFVCDPYVYLKSGAIEHSIEDCTYNSYEVAHPIYHMKTIGEFTLTVNGASFSGTGETFIDTDKMIAYDENNNIINTQTIGDFTALYLQEGENVITSNVEVAITPNWRSL